MLIPHRTTRRRAPVLLLVSLSLGACVDGTPLSPVEKAPVVAIPALSCTVDVSRGEMTCRQPEPAQTNLAIAANRMIGGQDVYVKLSNSGNSYDAGTEIFQTSVTVQNLLQAPLGTSDGSTVDGVKIFFYSGPTVSGGGTGEVTVANPTGHEFFTAPNQPYFQYAQILGPYEISSAIAWQFNVPATATRFTFVVYVSAPQADESMPLLDKVWLGSADASWTNAANWRNGLVPDSASVVAVPPDSLMEGTFSPTLGADAQLTHLRVGGANVLGLGGFTLTAWGNVDAPGTISGGSLRMAGANTVLRGTLPAVRVTGSVRLQGATRATGPVTISDGSVAVGTGKPLTISLP